MGSNSVNPIIAIAAVVILLALVGYFGFRAVTPPAPAAGSYTPGVPPWLDNNSPSYGKAQASPGGASAGPSRATGPG